jgi:hypothetical protein
MSVLNSLKQTAKDSVSSKFNSIKSSAGKTAKEKNKSTVEKYISNTRFGTDSLPPDVITNQSVIFYVKLAADAEKTAKQLNTELGNKAKEATNALGATKPDNSTKGSTAAEAKATLDTPGSNSLMAALKSGGKSAGKALVQKNYAADVLKNGKTLATITLPLPNSLNESISHNWEKSNSAIATAIKNGISSIDSTTILKNSDGTGGINNAASTVGDAITWGMSAMGGRYPIIDPGFFQNYSGTDPRSFSFSWDFVVQTEAEANKLFDIVRKFKGYSSPGIVFGNAVLESPNYWVIAVQNPKLRDALNLQPVVVSRVDVDYAGSGFMDMYQDGTPKYIKLSISFTEIRAVVRDDWGVASDSNLTPGDSGKTF